MCKPASMKSFSIREWKPFLLAVSSYALLILGASFLPDYRMSLGIVLGTVCLTQLGILYVILKP